MNNQENSRPQKTYNYYPIEIELKEVKKWLDETIYDDFQVLCFSPLLWSLAGLLTEHLYNPILSLILIGDNIPYPDWYKIIIYNHTDTTVYSASQEYSDYNAAVTAYAKKLLDKEATLKRYFVEDPNTFTF